MSNFYVPRDLVEDILSRLPVKSLLRFKCVAKSWYLVINSPEFVKMQAKRSENTESNKKFIAGGLPCEFNQTFKLYALPSNFPESSKAITNVEEINYPSISNDVYVIWLVGSCNGLLCLVVMKQDPTVILWNPSTREYQVLPSCSKQHRSVNDFDTWLYGFGYDEVTDDYKVVGLIIYRDDLLRPTFGECLIYSLNSNKWRRSLEILPSYNLKETWNKGVLTNGALHWRLKDNFILAFNLATEKFQLIPPPVGSRKSHAVSHLTHDGCISLLCETFRPSVSSEIWMMKDYGNKDSWTKLTLDLSTNIWRFTPFQLSKSDKYILLQGTNGSRLKYVLYDFEEQSFNEVKFPVELTLVYACVYSESLVKLINGTVEMNGASKTSSEEEREEVKKDQNNTRKLRTKLKKSLQTIKGFTCCWK